MNSISPILNIMIKACEKASKVIIRDFGEIENIQLSHDKIDKFVSKSLSYLIDSLKNNLEQSRENWGVLFKNQNKKLEKDKFYWLVEPINGVENFKRGIRRITILKKCFYKTTIRKIYGRSTKHKVK